MAIGGNEVGRVVYAIAGDNSQFQSDVNQTESIAGSAGGRIAKAIGGAFAGAVVAAGAALGSLAKTGIEYNSKMEGYSTAFTTLMGGNAEAANGLIGSIRDLAASTPLAMEGLASGAQTLMGYGMAGDQVIDTLQMLGDASMGDAEKLNSMVLAYSQVQASGKLMGQDALQMINAGVPIYQLLGEAMGVTAGEAKAMGEEGKISAEMVTEALKTATSEGGMYYGAMAAQAETLSGRVSTLKDNFNQFAGEITESLMPAAAGVVEALNNMITGNDNLKGALTSVFDSIGKLVVSALPPLIDLLAAVFPILAEVVAAILPPLVDIVNALLPPLMEIISAVLPVIADLLATLAPIISEIAGVWSEWISTLLPPLIDFIGQLIGPIGEIAEALLPAWKEIMEAMLPVYSALLDSALGPLLDIFMAIIDPLTELLSTVLPPLMSLFSALSPILVMVAEALSPILELAGTLIGMFFDMLEPVGEVAAILIDVLAGAFEALTPYIEGAMDLFGDLIDFIVAVFTGDWEGAWEAIGNIFTDIMRLIPQGLETMVNGAIAILNGLIDGLNKVLDALGIAQIAHIGGVDFTPWNDDMGGGTGSGSGKVGIGSAQMTRNQIGEDFISADWTPIWADRGERILTAADNVKFNTLGGLQGMERALDGGIGHGSATPIRLQVQLKGDAIMDGYTVGKVIMETFDDVIATTVGG